MESEIKPENLKKIENKKREKTGIAYIKAVSQAPEIISTGIVSLSLSLRLSGV